MIGIRYNGQFLDVNPEASFGWELNNLVFVNADPGKLPGSFSFPYDLKATSRNRSLLNYPERVDNAEVLLENADVDIYVEGKVVFRGKMKITNASTESIRAYFIVNPLSEIKKTPLNEFDLGGDRSFTGDLAEHMNEVCVDHLAYDYGFFPVYNTAFLTKPVTNPKGDVQNYFHSATGTFEADHAYPAVMPFVRLDYLLSRIFDATEYAFENGFQINDELRSLYVYNNRSVWRNTGYPSSFNLQNHVSKTPASSFVRKLAGAFCLGLFYSPWEKVLKLLPMQSVATREARWDWTSKLIPPTEIQSNDNLLERVTWREDAADLAWQKNADLRKANESPYLGEPVLGDVLYADLSAQANGLYFVPDKHAYYRVTSSTPEFVYALMGSEPVATGNPVFEAECAGLWDIALISQEVVPVHQALSGATWPDTTFELLPHIDVEGTVEYFFSDGSGTSLVNQDSECPDRLMIYRGMYPNMVGNDYPLAAGIPYDNEGNLIGEYALRWDGEQGMFNRWWSNWFQILRYGKHVTAKLALSITDILEFKFEDKVRIGNQEYFVKKMRINMTPRGLDPVQVELVSTR